ncbi:MAG TPA: 50S ribosomal protein L9 [bacterium]|nr:50S ribosomal protein L9 [bacterium]HOL66825.1 50S ribosomal protein L9 [bacterium]HPP11515.1 50S ribosomal protein L9 [bacterium]
MKVVFLQDIPGQAQQGEIKEVRPGYARNYLIPKGLAAEASQAVIQQLQRQKEQKRARARKLRQQAEEIRQKLERASITIRARAGQDDKLFGAVTSEDIAAAIKEQVGVEIDRHQIVLEQPLKKLDIYKVPVRVAEEVEAEIKVWLVRET